ncbi:MAG: hypothetical protein M0Z79_12760 [Nitrospiraceae bacterium]|nr:hypothetical protein [Nitrospiraceae bacterium]
MRLVTRGDLDGVTSAVLITSMEQVGSIELLHPQDITDKRVKITAADIVVNLPFHPDCGMWFDHHELTDSNEKPPAIFRGKHAIAPSAARVIYDYYNAEQFRKYQSLVSETDRFDAARLTKNDVLDPAGVILLGYTIDSRSGIGRFKDYFSRLVEWLQAMPVEEVLRQPEVAERAKLLRESNRTFLQALGEHSRLEGNVIVTDFRSLPKPPVGNRFLVYTLFPAGNISVRLQWGPDKKFVTVSIGHNIFNRTSKANCGRICGEYGGGGHLGAGSCPIPTSETDRSLNDIIRKLQEAG